MRYFYRLDCSKILIKLIIKIYNSCINNLKKSKDPSESSEPSEASETSKIDTCYCIRDLLQQNPNPPYDIPDYFRIIYFNIYGSYYKKKQ